MRSGIVTAALVVAATTSIAAAQLQPRLSFTFVDVLCGVDGCAGVARAASDARFYVCDSTNALTVHEFDATGAPLGAFGTAGCSPPAFAPRGIAYDLLSDGLWVLDDTAPGGLATNVVAVDRAGQCGGGFAAVVLRPGGIAYDLFDDALWIADAGQVTEWSRSGTFLGRFSFSTPLGQRRLTGITALPQRQRFLIVASGEPFVYEVDRSGALRSTTDLSPFGITDPEGLYLDPTTGTLAVAEGPSANVFVFDVGLCKGVFHAFGQGCPDPTGVALTLEASGCAEVGNTFVFTLRTGAANTLGVWFAAGLRRDVLGGGIPLPLDLTPFGAPGCFIYTSHDASVGPFPNPGGGASLNVTVPLDNALRGGAVHWQGFQFGAGIPGVLPVVTSNGVTVFIG
jgi:hypothetical protein